MYGIVGLLLFALDVYVIYLIIMGRNEPVIKLVWVIVVLILPLLGPAIFASAVLVFSGVIDDFVIVDLLSSNAGNTPMSVIIYSTQHGGNGGPALNALGTISLVMSFIIAIIGYIGYRWLTRGERGSRIQALTTIAGSEA